MYWVATTIMAAAEAPCQEPLVKSCVTELNDDAADAKSSARLSHAEAAASSGPAPGPANISAELISGGNHAKCGLVTDPTYLAEAITVALSVSRYGQFLVPYGTRQTETGADCRPRTNLPGRAEVGTPFSAITSPETTVAT